MTHQGTKSQIMTKGQIGMKGHIQRGGSRVLLAQPIPITPEPTSIRMENSLMVGQPQGVRAKVATVELD